MIALKGHGFDSCGKIMRLCADVEERRFSAA